MKCPYCGNDVDINDETCPYCFRNIDTEENHDLRIQLLREKYMKKPKPAKNKSPKPTKNENPGSDKLLIPVGILGLIVSLKKIFDGNSSFYNIFMLILSFSLIIGGIKKKKRKG